jgi:hypothetical protein
MSGDYTRWSFDPTKNFSEVFKQQGRVDLDADWNEAAEINDRRWRAETIDIIGRAIVPTPDAFAIKPTGPGQFTIGIGRMYVDGLLAECHGLPPLTYDASLGEQNGTNPVPFNQQPYFPSPSPLPSAAGATDLIYLDVWHREVTVFEEPSIREIALGGPDTTTRAQTVWQVKVLPGVGAHACGDNIPLWDDLIAPSAGRLTTSTVAPTPSPDPCVLSPTGGYRGLENRLYRIEVHTAGTVGGANPARFKWSRDNASVVSAVDSISAPGGPNSVVKLKSLGRDRVLRFKADDWVEILDDNLELGGATGFLTKIIGPPDEANRTITVSPPIPAAMFDPSQPRRHTRVRRWDQKFTGAGSDVNPTTGLIDVTAGPLDIEDGIQVSFSDDPAGKTLHVGDYWLFAARTADGSVEALTKAPPRGVLHHYARLGFVTWTPTGGTFSPDCRVFWPPSFGGGEQGCDCTVCVTPKGHNGGTATINKAVTDTIAKGGGKICLSPGLYFINQRVEIAQAAAIQIVGHGLAFLTPGGNLAGGDPLIQVENSVDIRIEDLGFIALEAAGAAGQSLPGIVIQDSAFALVRHCSFIGFRGGTTLSPAIALGGTVLDSLVAGNLMANVQVGVGPTSNRDKQRFLAFLSVRNNQMACMVGGIELVGSSRALALEVEVRANSISAPVGVAFQGTGLDLTVDSNAIVLAGEQTGSGTGIFSTISQSRIVNNDITGVNTQTKSVGIELASTLYGTQIIGNRISALGGTGILMGEDAHMLETIIARNQLLNLGRGGIVMVNTASAVDLNIAGNSLAFVAQSVDPTDPDQPFMVGMQLIAALDVNLDGNAIEDLGLDPNQSGVRAAIYGGLFDDLRVAGNRIQNIGPTGLKQSSGGVVLVFLTGRVDIADNEIRRAIVPPANGDASDWNSLVLEACINDVSVRGNLLESFGVGLAALIGSPKVQKLNPASCIFTENQCFLDNPSGAASRPVVQIAALSIIAGNNYAKGPGERGTIDLDGPFNTASNTLTGPITVVGNLTSGRITINGGALPANPFGPLNVLLP